MSDFSRSSIAFQIILLIYMIIFFVLIWFKNKGDVTNSTMMRTYFFVSMLVMPILSVLSIGLIAGDL